MIPAELKKRFIDALLAAGWKSPNDAQWENIDAVIAEFVYVDFNKQINNHLPSDKCIRPDCECLDFCEAADPYSETPKKTDLKSSPRFANVSCSQCGGLFGPGDHGFSHCENHAELRKLD